jgi:hypothetical protein
MFFRLHYTEYLVDLINKNGIDPADKMSIDEMNIVFQRSEVECPARLPAEGDDDYRQRIFEVSDTKTCCDHTRMIE